MMQQFLLGHTTGTEPRELVSDCLEQMGPIPQEANFGFVYATDALARELDAILRLLKQSTGVQDWVGTVGMAINVTAHEYYDQPALAVMIGHFPQGSCKLIAPQSSETDAFGAELENDYPFGLLHGDPSNPATPQLMQQLAQTTGTFLAGGITSSQSDNLQVAGEICQGGISGALFTAAVPVVTAHTQGCAPIGPRHSITHSQRNILAELDHRPALEVFKDDIGEIMAKDLNRAAGYIFAALPIASSDTGDYMVRNLIGIDPRQNLIAIGDYVQEGDEIMFCRRDGNSAREDMLHMLEDLKQRAQGRAPKGAVYYSCLGRGRHQFGDDSEELKMIRDELGEFPLVGFFANGEIFHNRLYGYTGVLTLFL